MTFYQVCCRLFCVGVCRWKYYEFVVAVKSGSRARRSPRSVWIELPLKTRITDHWVTGYVCLLPQKIRLLFRDLTIHKLLILLLLCEGKQIFAMLLGRHLLLLSGMRRSPFLALSLAKTSDWRSIMSQSKYQPFDDASKQIRLLKFLSSRRQPCLQLAMTAHDLFATSGPKYYALSYSWHPEGPKKTIKVNGVVHMIGFNLWRFLKRLKQLGRTRFLWADALCINQGDPIEKSKQVGMMGHIYKSASDVLVWLGEEHRASGLVMDLANQECKSWEPGEDTMKQWKALMEICKRQ